MSNMATTTLTPMRTLHHILVDRGTGETMCGREHVAKVPSGRVSECKDCNQRLEGGLPSIPVTRDAEQEAYEEWSANLGVKPPFGLEETT